MTYEHDELLFNAAKAWNDCGISPQRHRELQQKLQREWPTLAKALIALPWELPPPRWIDATWGHVRAGDTVRLGSTEAIVESTSVPSSGPWHIDASNRYQPRPWEHMTADVKLKGRHGLFTFPPGSSVEILMNAERYAQHVLMQSFPNTTEIEA